MQENPSCPECHGANVIEMKSEKWVIDQVPGEDVGSRDWVQETVWFKCWDCENTFTEHYEYAD